MELQKKIYNFILDYWKLIKEYTPRPAEDDTERWEKILEDVDALGKKYKDDSREYQFFYQMLFLWLRYMGREELKDAKTSRMH